MILYQLTGPEREAYRRYAGLALPRHTSYPVVPVWSTTYGPADFRKALRRSAAERRPLSLYIHIPFCERLCYYCACTKEIIPRARRQENDPGRTLLDGLEIEAARLAEGVGGAEVHQVHLGGGTPTFLDSSQLKALSEIMRRYFSLAADAEIAIEIDPRVTTWVQLETLRSLGFNRVSLGIQDFAPTVQRVVNRLQPLELVERAVGWCRQLGFDSMNFDIIYGLPFQTPQTMADTLDKTIALQPDRIAFYRLAVIPEMFRWQNVFKHTDLPTSEECLELNLLAINRFREAGYEFIGLDHFARPDESLAQARRAGSLRRTFQGMTTGHGLDIIGLGPSAISQLDDALAQNHKTTADWSRAIATDLATERGMDLASEDRLRRELMQALYGYGTIDKRILRSRFGIDFDEHFADERQRLTKLIEDGLVVDEADAIRLTAPLGRLLVRVVAAVFDAYLPPRAFHEGLPAQLASKVG